MNDKPFLAVVIRKDGTVPFDDDVSASDRAHMIAHLADQGHQLEPVAGTRHMKVKNFKKGR